MTDRAPGPTWRADQREPVRYASPVPDGARHAVQPISPRRGTPAAGARTEQPTTQSMAQPTHPQAPGTVVLEPPHLASLTPAQRADLRLWGGRVNLLDRVKATRRHAAATAVLLAASAVAFVAGIAEVPPLVLAPIIPGLMARHLVRRGRSLREAGLRFRRVLLARSARRVLPAPPPVPSEQQLQKLAPREILDGPRGTALRRAAEDRAAILAVVGDLPKADRALLPDVAPTANGLVERVAHLAQSLHRLDQSIDPREVDAVDARIAEVEREGDSPEGQRRLSLLRRQRATLQDLVQHRALLARQLDNAGLALGNLRLDLVKLRSSGLESALSDVSTATQEARALSREIGVVLEAAAEVRTL
jgi:serine/threonine-protein kinase